MSTTAKTKFIMCVKWEMLQFHKCVRGFPSFIEIPHSEQDEDVG